MLMQEKCLHKIESSQEHTQGGVSLSRPSWMQLQRVYQEVQTTGYTQQKGQIRTAHDLTYP